jgi:glycerophosphoryl diester phosphodiesterase
MEVIAHRGTPRERPENSLPGFRHAIALGADGIELDVHLTVDGVLVVHHDPLLAAPTPGSPRPRIRELTREALSAYPIAYGVPIPTLEDVLTVVGREGRGKVTLYVEVKAPGAEGPVVESIHRSRVTCAVHGFDHRVSLRTAELDPKMPTGILLDSYLVDPASALRAARARDYWQQWEFVDRELVATVHAAGGRVIAWTVNDPTAALSLRDMGVDAVCTDVCGSLASALRLARQ